MFSMLALMGLWPRVDLPPVAPHGTAVPLNWTPVGPEGGSVLSVYTFGNGDTVLAVAWPNLWMSTNQGANWTQIISHALFGGEDGTLTDDRSILIAREGGLIIRTTDWGMSWDTVLSDISLEYKILNQEKLSAVYCAGKDTAPPMRIAFYRSTDNGMNWEHTGSTSYWDEMYA
ncbi:MAG: WD40/YVTN/BNR-like repeat-containing protein, partial [Candidatus Hydrothermia bacterium]